jgi:hypothetical protein
MWTRAPWSGNQSRTQEASAQVLARLFPDKDLGRESFVAELSRTRSRRRRKRRRSRRAAALRADPSRQIGAGCRMIR